MEDGTRLYEPAGSKDEAIKHFSSILNGPSSTYPGKDFLSPYINKCLTREQASSLSAPISATEVKRSMFSIAPDKAPRPDGSNGFFFRKVWHIVGEDIIKAVQSFFEEGHLLKELNHTSLTLVPKAPNSSKLHDFRPIACCSTVYKCISKVLANRIKPLLPALIGNAQSAFVLGRTISDNILLAQELLKNYHRKDSPPRCAIKVDIQKALTH